MPSTSGLLSFPFVCASKCGFGTRTATTSGSRSASAAKRVSARRLAGSFASPRASVATTSTGPFAPAPSFFAASSAPTRVSCASGNWRSAPSPVCSEIAGIASASSTPELSATVTQGRRVTRAVQRSQKPVVGAAARPPGRSPRSERAIQAVTLAVRPGA